MNICGAITCRGKICAKRKSDCIFHQKGIIDTTDDEVILFTPQGKKICGVEVTGHGKEGKMCTKPPLKGYNRCVYHIYAKPKKCINKSTTNRSTNRSTNKRKKIQNIKEIAELLVNLSNYYES